MRRNISPLLLALACGVVLVGCDSDAEVRERCNNINGALYARWRHYHITDTLTYDSTFLCDPSGTAIGVIYSDSIIRTTKPDTDWTVQERRVLYKEIP